MVIKIHEVSADASDSSAVVYVSSRPTSATDNPSLINVLMGHTCLLLANSCSSAVKAIQHRNHLGKGDIEASTAWQVRKVKLQAQRQH